MKNPFLVVVHGHGIPRDRHRLDDRHVAELARHRLPSRLTFDVRPHRRIRHLLILRFFDDISISTLNFNGTYRVDL